MKKSHVEFAISIAALILVFAACAIFLSLYSCNAPVSSTSSPSSISPFEPDASANGASMRTEFQEPTPIIYVH